MPADQPDWILRARRELGRRVAAARMDADLTQERLAERTGIDRSTTSSSSPAPWASRFMTCCHDPLRRMPRERT